MQHLINQGILPIQIFIDVAAAYDSVEWDKLAQTLQLKNFKQTEITLIMNLMTNMKAITSTVWGDSEEFPLQRGVPQGDSLSPIILIIFMDTIIRIMNKKKLQSTLLQHSTQGYVDDIWGIVEDLNTAKTNHLDKKHTARHTESIATLNSMGWKHNTKGDKWIPKTKTITSLMRAEDIQILGLTELDWKSEEQINHFMDQLPPDFIGIGAQGREPDRPQSTTGVALLIHNNTNNPIELSHTKKCPTGRWISTRINREDKSSIRIMVIYAPAGNKPESTKPRTQLCEDIHKWSKAQTGYMAATDKRYLLGDFNASLHGNKTKDIQFQTLLKTAGLKSFNNQQHGTTFYGSGHNTLIDYITGNSIATDMHCHTTIQKVPEIQTDHKIIITTTQTTTAMRNGNKNCTRNKAIRNTKLYRTRSKEVWQRAFTDILLQQKEDLNNNKGTNWEQYIQKAGEKFMSKGKAKQ